MRPLLFRTAAALALATILGACTQKNTADQQAQDAAAAADSLALGVDRLLLFPNPIGTDPFAQNGGTFETDTTDYTTAYYAAIDPNNDKDTLDKWRQQNAFVGYALPARQGQGTEHLAVFRDVKDLGYGRRMTGRFNSDDNSVAFYVENYNVAPNGSAGYSSELNVDAAIRRDTQWHVGTNAIEWSTTTCIPGYDPPDCNGTVKFAKYYNFSSVDGTRQLAVDLDGHGLKAMPGPCITCHGGRGDPLTPPDVSNKPRFPLVENSLSRKRGDVQGRLHGQNVDSFAYSTTQAGFAKSDLQPFLKDFNQWILCTYPTPTAANVVGGWGTCNRPLAGPNEWQGTAGPMIEYWYGGPGMPNTTFSERCDVSGQPCYVPAGWSANAAISGTTFTDTALYQNVVAPYCRTCHILRGTKNQSDADFTAFGVPAAGVNPATGFLSYADRIKVHVFDRGNMPLAQIPHSDFWNSSAPQMLASFIDARLGAGTATSNGAALMPGRPIADPGPDRMVRTGANAILSAENSLFSSTFSWAQDPANPAGATIANPNSMVAIFNAPTAGDYIVNLVVGNGAQTDTKTATITVSDTFPDPLSLKLAHVKNVLQNITYTTSQVTAQKCVTCHSVTATPLPARTPPIWYSNFDRDGSGVVDTTDDAWLLKALAGRVNLTEIAASPLLRKPTGNHHNGLMLLDVTDKSNGGGLSSYSVLYNWILAGMQPGGVAANATVNNGTLGTPASPVLFTFNGPVGGPYASPSIALDGSASLGANLTYAWTVFGPPGPLGTLPAIASPTSAVTTLSVYQVGTYVVQLQVSDGVSTDTVQRTIVIDENPISAIFTPATGTAQVTFAGSPVRGPITLTSTSTGGPVSCRWQVFGAAGATLGTFPAIVTDLTQSCGSAATLSVPVSAIGSSYTIQLTASNLASSVAVHSVVIAAAAGQNVANANFTFPAASIGFSVTSPGGAVTPSITGVALSGSATGLAPITYTWSLPSGAGSAGCGTPASGQSTTLPVSRAGTCDVTLTVSNGLPGTASITRTVTITSTVVFSQVAAILGNAGTASPGSNAGCTGCHDGSTATPDWRSSTAGLAGRLAGVIDGTQSSLLLICPTFGTGAGGNAACMPSGAPFLGFGSGNLSNYNAFLTWILNGQP